jgi:hypothetical protein
VKTFRRHPLVIAAIGAAVWAWYASGVRTFTRPAEVLTFLPGLAVLLLTLRPSASSARSAASGTQSVAPHRRWGVLPWLAVLVAIIGWEMAELFSQPRHAHPTISSLMNSLLSTHPSRFVGYLVWLILGWLLVRDLGRRR